MIVHRTLQEETMNLGEVCIHVLGKSAFCMGVSFNPSIPLLGGIATLVCIICGYLSMRNKAGDGNLSTNKRVGRKYDR